MRLHLTLYKKYFYQILNKEKTIEYRAIKPFWEKKFSDMNKYNEILFVNGYGKKRPFFIIELLKIKRNNKYFELYLGSIKEIGNISQNELSLFENTK